MKEHDNVQLMRRWFQEIWNEGRLETIDELMAPDGVAHDLTGPGGDVRRPAAFKDAARVLRSAFEDIRVDVDDIFGSDDRVAIRLTITMTHTGELGDLRPTHARISSPLMCIVHVRDGQIVEGWNFWDVASVLRATAAPPERRTLL
ncbi:ester cyclase [Verrucomicrobiota bacterium sgz303538]